MNLHPYLPQDRLRALGRGETLPDRTQGSVLFADISGFTSLTETLRATLGPRRGAEELTRQLDAVFATLITAVEVFGGSVIGFAGDAITCWFDETHGPAATRATACALALQQAMTTFAEITLQNGAYATLALYVTVASGPAPRVVVGNPQVHYMDTLAGVTVARSSIAEHLAHKGEVLLDNATVQALGGAVTVREWRTENAERFAVLAQFTDETPPAWSASGSVLAAIDLQDWVHSPVARREQSGYGSFLNEFRPCVAMFVRFLGIDFDAAEAEAKLDAFVRHVQTLTRQYESTLMQLTIGDKGSYLHLNLGNLLNERQDFLAAREYTHQAYALARVLGVQDVIALGALNLADVDIKLGDFTAARSEIHEGLALALRIGLPPRVLQAVRMCASLNHYEGQTERALSLLGLAQRRPAWTDAHQHDAETVLSQWALDPEEVEAGLAKGAALDWDLTIQELLKG